MDDAHSSEGPNGRPKANGKAEVGPNGQAEPQGQQEATTGATGDAALTAPVPEVRATIKVHKTAPEADEAALSEFGCTWDVEGKHWRRGDGRRVCGAHPLSPRGPCRQSSIYSSGRCKFHGGKSLRGIASATYKHGRWSKAFGSRGDTYQAARDDPQLLDLRRTIGALDVTVTEALARQEALDTPDFRRRALAMYNETQAAMADDLERASELLNTLGAFLRRGAAADAAAEYVARSVSRMSTHIEKAWTIKLGSGQSINKSDLMAIIESFVEVITRELPPEYVGPILVGLDREVFRGRLAFAGLDTATD